MTRLIATLRAFLFGTSEPPRRAGTLYEHVHLDRRTQPSAGAARTASPARPDGESATFEVCG
jgi:hypothetical protein